MDAETVRIQKNNEQDCAAGGQRAPFEEIDVRGVHWVYDDFPGFEPSTLFF
ncbi:MAG: hypothetical protein ACLQG3_01505 [Terracidiphilus sp.]